MNPAPTTLGRPLHEDFQTISKYVNSSLQNGNGTVCIGRLGPPWRSGPSIRRKEELKGVKRGGVHKPGGWSRGEMAEQTADVFALNSLHQ